jgi:iron-sulfur cluster repair di-iron protein
MEITSEMTLGDVVTEHPTLARELERRGLDYCCGGGRTVADACADRGLDANTVVAELSAATGDDSRAEWASMDAVALVDHLELTHHLYLWDEMPRLSALADKVLGVHGARHPELHDIRRCWSDVRADLEPHLLKEEKMLFPMIRELAAARTAPDFHCGSLGNPISVMLHEHDHVGELLVRLRSLTNGYRPPADACASYEAWFAGLEALEGDTHLHIHKENNLLFPAVVLLERAASERGS